MGTLTMTSTSPQIRSSITPQSDKTIGKVEIPVI